MCENGRKFNVPEAMRRLAQDITEREEGSIQRQREANAAPTYRDRDRVITDAMQQLEADQRIGNGVMSEDGRRRQNNNPR